MAEAEREEAGDGAEGAVTAVYQKRTLIDAVAASTGVKKKTVKPLVDAVLAELSAALARGDALSLSPLGKVTVNRTKEGTKAEVLILKLRRPRAGTAAAEAADSDEDGED